MLRITCPAHEINRVAEKIRETFPLANKLVNNGNTIFLKAPSRICIYKNIMDGPLPPTPIITRWGTCFKWRYSIQKIGINFVK